MKRDPRLAELSREHHHALVLARRARRAAEGHGSRSSQDVWGEVVRRFAAELAPHFEIEERLILPALELRGEEELAARARDDHARLRRLVCDDEGCLQARLEEFGSVLTEHVRFEEREMFPIAEEKLSKRSLDAVAAACAKARDKRGQTP